MTPEQFEATVRRLEQVAKQRPASYRLRVAALAGLGYGYVFAVGVGALALLALLVAAAVGAAASGRVNAGLVQVVGKLGLALLALVSAVGRALWVTLEAPQGIPLTRDEFPQLFKRIERVRVLVDAPPVQVVLLTDDFNAAVVQQPRLGVFGWHKNYLLLGLPLLRALSREQFDAVLAHEFGHLSGAHGRLGGWIYRARAAWGRILETMEREKHWASFIFLPFVRWYAPYFNAYSFVQARAQEYQADRAGAAASSPRAMADALLCVEIRARELGAYWARVRSSANELPEPVNPFTQMRFGEPDAARAGEAIQQALRAETTLSNTHPCLRERLAALGAEPRTPPAPHTSAAELLLGARLTPLAEALDRSWQDNVRNSWRERHRQATQARARLAELSGRRGPLPRNEAWERAKLSEEFEGPEAGRARYREMLALDPNDAPALFAVGRLLLEAGDAAGLEQIERAGALDAEAILPGTELAVAFLRRHGREEEARGWIERAQPHLKKVEEARRERSQVRLDDRYERAGIDDSALQRLLDVLRARPGVKRAWLVRRQVQHFPESPLFVLGIERRRSGWDFVSRAGRRARDLALQNTLLRAPVPGECFVLVLNHRGRKVRRLFSRVDGSLILDR